MKEGGVEVRKTTAGGKKKEKRTSEIRYPGQRRKSGELFSDQHANFYDGLGGTGGGGTQRIPRASRTHFSVGRRVEIHNPPRIKIEIKPTPCDLGV